MKVKHIIFWHFAIASMLVIVGCAVNTDLDRKIKAWQEAHPDRDGDCMIIAMKQCDWYKSQGISARLCRGLFKGTPHAWCEYYDKLTDTWLVDDPAIWYIGKGYQREAYRSGNVCDYDPDWYGEN